MELRSKKRLGHSEPPAKRTHIASRAPECLVVGRGPYATAISLEQVACQPGADWDDNSNHLNVRNTLLTRGRLERICKAVSGTGTWQAAWTVCQPSTVASRYMIHLTGAVIRDVKRPSLHLSGNDSMPLCDLHLAQQLLEEALARPMPATGSLQVEVRYDYEAPPPVPWFNTPQALGSTVEECNRGIAADCLANCEAFWDDLMKVVGRSQPAAGQDHRAPSTSQDCLPAQPDDC